MSKKIFQKVEKLNYIFSFGKAIIPPKMSRSQDIITIEGTPEKMERFYSCITEDGTKTLSFEKTISSGVTKFDRGFVEKWHEVWGASEPYDCEVLEDTSTEYVVRCLIHFYPPFNWAKAVCKKFEVNIQIAYAYFTDIYIDTRTGLYGTIEVTQDSSTWKEYDFLPTDYVKIDCDCTEDEKRKGYCDCDWIAQGRLKDHMDKYQLTSVGYL